MNAIAISNNDMVYLHWTFIEKIPGCLGFSVIRHDDRKGSATPLPAMVGFKGDAPAGNTFKNTDIWPIQKYSWKDLFAERGGTYWYEIVPMIGKPGKLKRDQARAMRTNSVTLDPDRGTCSVYFNRGIISTQALARLLPKTKNGAPNSAALKDAIQRPTSRIRKLLVGGLEIGVLSLIKRAQKEGGECYCALYELSDSDLIGELKALGKKLHLVLSNAGEDTEDGSGDGDSTNQQVRKDLHAQAGVEITDRMFNKGHIGHNKFVVYVKHNKAVAVLCGSTNWTATGLCAQSNNSMVIESPELADEYWQYWKRLKQDTQQANGTATQLQAKPLRDRDAKPNSAHKLSNESGQPSGSVEVWFSPNTKQKSVPRPKPATPPDLQEVFAAIDAAQQGALFLAFIPGNPSIVSKLKETYDQKRQDGSLFYLRGAATSPDPASDFRVELYHRTARSNESVRAVADPPTIRSTSAGVVSVAGIFAAFAAWEAEIYKLGHAVIHDKILVLDPFTDHSVVVTGSHNLGFKASYANDENLVIIRNDRAVAEAYAAHVLDVYEHYRWRWKVQEPIRDELARLKKKKPNAEAADLWREAIANVGGATLKKTWQYLAREDTWQDYYVQQRATLAAEDNFWSSFGGVGSNPTPASGSRRRRKPL